MSIAVSVDATVDNQINILFTGWHGNSHGWEAKIISSV